MLLEGAVGRAQGFGHLAIFPSNYYGLEGMFTEFHVWYWMQVAGWMQEKMGRCISEKKIINEIRLQKSCFPRNFQWNPCCALYREFSAVPRDLQPQEREMENSGAAVAAVWRRVCLWSLISAVTGNIQKTKPCTFLCIHPLVARTRQDPWFSPSHSFAFLPAKLSRADTGICSCPCQGLPRKDAEDVLDILELPCVELQEPPANQHKPPSHLVRPHSWEWEMSKITAWCQLLSRSPPLLSHLSLAIGTRCTLPALLALPAEFYRVIFLGTLVLKMSRLLSFGRSLLAKAEISKPSEIDIAKLYPPHMIDCSIPVQFSTAHLPQSFQQQPVHSDGQSSLAAFRVIYSAHELSSHDCSKG